MEIKRTTEILIEKTRRFVVRRHSAVETISCPACGEQMLAAEASAALFKIKYRRVYQFVEANAVHFAETVTGAMFVCPQSLDAAIGNIDGESPVEIAELLSDSAAENQSREIEIN